jgi:hypothetical protein
MGLHTFVAVEILYQWTLRLTQDAFSLPIITLFSLVCDVRRYMCKACL